MSHANKTIAYIDRQIDDEILDIAQTDVLPRRGASVEIDDERWQVYDVKPVKDTHFDALVTVERKT